MKGISLLTKLFLVLVCIFLYKSNNAQCISNKSTETSDKSCAELYSFGFVSVDNHGFKNEDIAAPIGDFLVLNFPDCFIEDFAGAVPHFEVCPGATVEIEKYPYGPRVALTSCMTHHNFLRKSTLIVTSEDKTNVKEYFLVINFHEDSCACCEDQIIICSCCPTTSISDLNGDNINIYPNPAKNIVNVKCEKSSQVKIFNMTGKLVYAAANNGSDLNVNVANFAQGNYIVKIVNNKNVYTRKFEVVK